MQNTRICVVKMDMANNVKGFVNIVNPIEMDHNNLNNFHSVIQKALWKKHTCTSKVFQF